MTRILFAVPALAVIAALPARAEMLGPGFQPCDEKPAQSRSSKCVQEKTNVADQRRKGPSNRANLLLYVRNRRREMKGSYAPLMS